MAKQNFTQDELIILRDGLISKAKSFIASNEENNKEEFEKEFEEWMKINIPNNVTYTPEDLKINFAIRSMVSDKGINFRDVFIKLTAYIL